MVVFRYGQQVARLSLGLIELGALTTVITGSKHLLHRELVSSPSTVDGDSSLFAFNSSSLLLLDNSLPFKRLPLLLHFLHQFFSFHLFIPHILFSLALYRR